MEGKHVKESWRRDHAGGFMKEYSWRKDNGGRVSEEASSIRSYLGGIWEASGRLEASGGPLNQEVHSLPVLARTGKLRSMLVHFFVIVNSPLFFDLSSLMSLL